MRRQAKDHFALRQRLGYQPELVLLQIAQAAVDQFGAGAGSMRGQVVLLAKRHGQAPTGRIPRDARAVDATTDHQDVRVVVQTISRMCLAIVSLRTLTRRRSPGPCDGWSICDQGSSSGRSTA